MYAPRDREDEEAGLAARAAWLSCVGGYTHEDIAARMHLTRIKVTRLVAKAHQLGLVRVFVEGGSADCVALEDELIRRFDLRFAGVTPTLDRGVLPLIALGNAGARYLHDVLGAGDVRIVGVGHGRTLGAVVDALPRLARPGVKFVSLLGSLIRHVIANPFGIIHRLAAQTNGEGYFMPVPFVADSVAKALFMDQTGLKPVFDLAARADLHVVGIGEIGEDSFMGLSGMITADEFERLGEFGCCRRSARPLRRCKRHTAQHRRQRARDRGRFRGAARQGGGGDRRRPDQGRGDQGGAARPAADRPDHRRGDGGRHRRVGSGEARRKRAV